METITDIRQEQRLRYIDMCAYVLGLTNRRQLMNRFDIKEAWSTRDFKRYQQMAENNLVYNNRLKAYSPTKWFSPYYQHDIKDVIDLIANGTQKIVCQPKFSILSGSYSVPGIFPSLSVVAPIFRALNLEAKVEITYLSRTSGQSVRTIAPHTLIKTGNFVYVRAYDHKSGEFRSFKLNRVVSSRDSDITVAENHGKTFDNEWNTEIDVIVGINGSPENPKTIEFDYGLTNGRLAITMRRALLPFFLADWNIAPQDFNDLPETLFPLKVIDINPK